jgi:RNA methyltransferase, TrmH family
MANDQNSNRKRGFVKDITSLANPDIKFAKSLTLKKTRAEEQLFLAEGAKLAIDALNAGWRIDTLIVAASMFATPHIAELTERALATGANVLKVPEKAIAAITRRDNPQAVVSIIAERLARPEAIAPLQKTDSVIALDRVRDPGNLGTIIRTADAAGIKAVVLIGDCVDLFSLETVRATMGSLFAVPVIKMSAEALVEFAQDQKAQMIGTHLKGAVDYRTIDYASAPTVLLMGNEQSGLPDDLAKACNQLALIPQTGQADSLNLAVASALMIYEARRSLLKVGS